MLVLTAGMALRVAAQSECPPNIGFEAGNFNFWECLAGTYESTGLVAIDPTPAINGRHSIVKKGSVPLLDYYGQFPTTCPNGSGYSVKLGNDATGGQVDGVTYTFTIPPGRNDYSLVYHYAVVFQNPNHNADEQPKFTSRVFSVTDNRYIDCASFEFVASAGLPGFEESPLMDNVFYKPWAPITINLFGYAGKTIRLEFINRDCTLGAHFGYAYLDVNENCSTPITGNYTCIGAGNVTLEAPHGFQFYNWYTPDFSNLLGTKNVLSISPAPAAGTEFVLEVIPFPGLGCRDTVRTIIRPSNIPMNLQVIDSVVGCRGSPVNITAPSVTAGSSTGLQYAYFSDAAGANHVMFPEAIDIAGTYYIRAMNAEGCQLMKPVKVVLKEKPVVVTNNPAPVTFPARVDLTSLLITTGSESGLAFTYWKDVQGRESLLNPQSVGEAGTYYIKGTNATGCFSIKAVQVNILPPPPPVFKIPNAFSPNNDGINDVLRIEITGAFTVSHFSIYNRWGQVVYRTVNTRQPWDGSGLPVGTYYWVLEGVEGYTGKKVAKNGSVTLLR